MKRKYLLVPFLFLLTACEEAAVKDNDIASNELAVNSSIEKEVVMKDANEIVEQDLPEYLAAKKENISLEDTETAYELCMRALTDYYKAIWNGTDIQLGAFIENENLKRYTEKKIQYHIDMYGKQDFPNDSLESVVDNQEADWVVEFTDDKDGGYLYVDLPVEVKWEYGGSRGEATEFLVRNVNGKLVIVDWYTGGKDSYDFQVRGDNITVNNPEIWNNGDWVIRLEKEQEEFSGGIR